MTSSAALRSGKTHRDENFPVASLLIERRHRPIILAFYEFVRIADDIADHPHLAAAEKISRLDRLEASLLGENDGEPAGAVLRNALEERKLSAQHACDLLKAFRLDATKTRYDDWDDLIRYCSYSAMPVGRFVLDVHGEQKSTWPASDELCAVLQIINHLQDCGKDYRELDRVYLPLDILSQHSVRVDALGEPRASSALRGCLQDIAARAEIMLKQSRMLPDMICNRRLAMEISAIHALAGRLLRTLQERDPLSESVHLTKAQALMTGTIGMTAHLARRAMRTASNLHRPQAHEY